MADNNYTKEQTALLFVDPYNDFLSEGGKLWPYVQGVATDVGLLDNLRTITAAICKAGIEIFIVPHRRWHPGGFESWGHPNPDQIAGAQRQVFAKDSWVASGIPISRRRRATSSSKSIGAKTVLRIPISTCN